MKNIFFRILLGSIPFCVLSVVLFFVAFNSPTEIKISKNLHAVKGCVSLPENNDDVFWITGEFYFTPNKFNSLKTQKKKLMQNFLVRFIILR